jgi:hypothetical protein
MIPSFPLAGAISPLAVFVFVCFLVVGMAISPFHERMYKPVIFSYRRQHCN